MDIITKNFPMALIIALSVKAAVLGVNLSDSLVAVSLVGLLALREHLSKHKEMRELSDSTAKKMEEMKAAINKQNDVIAAQAAEFDKLRASMTGIKMQFGQKDTAIAANPLSKFGVKI
jgi:hypothetical protein